MRTRAMRVCGEVGCTAMTPGPRCPTHDYDRGRGSAHRRGYDTRHMQWRDAVLNRNPTCPCGAKATHADHIIPVRRGGRWEIDNGQGLCPACHNRKTAEERVLA